MIEINEPVHVVGEEIIERSHGEKECKQPDNMTDNLNHRFEIHQPVRPQKDENNEKAKRFKKKHRIPQDIIGGINELPFDDGTGGEIDKIPQADQAISTFPNPRDIVKDLQKVKNFFLKLINRIHW